MKVLILAGGYGTRLSEETTLRPKPMVEIGGKPILWHIMKIYSHYGYYDFIIMLGYKGFYIKEYFANYFLHQCDVTMDIKNNSMEIHTNAAEPWRVTLVDTGVESMTGGRIKRVQNYVGNEQFMLTYGDGVTNVNINDMVRYHNSHQGSITMLSSQPDGRFGALSIGDNGRVSRFLEKPKGDGGWVNSGFFICNANVFDYIQPNDQVVFEDEPLKSLAHNGELYAFQYDGFWKPMDTLRDKIYLEDLWQQKCAPWKVW
ncbi:glucose-1-phosphate cytidylyltransferase [Acidihalobacter aeolianus]|uniref:Glucose-1-phosphate cytidylyltransferase n=1 Tax=Acidihalobacter aeolianus TaxID=2792603 RepID=A0A1D8K925_9GAMM|nr:glucose-1-phosphate cytidylyltransferase [Acidihalobacter aeolianus]AOV17473.1 glucose-1-phosphate cytidylyltransferase [Acidihalobacter aeolianus]